MADFVTITEAAKLLDMRESTILRFIRDGRLTGFVDWSEVDAKMLPVRRPRQ
jgi:hypothetical protein